MNTHRSEFLDYFIKASPDLGTLFLNCTGSPSKLLSDLPVIDILSSKKGFKQFLSFTLNSNIISKVDLIPHFKKTEVWANFKDGTALHFMFYRNVVSHGMLLINKKDFFSAAHVNEFGMFVADLSRQFEYLSLKVQISGNPMPDRYRQYFTNLPEDIRQPIFKHVQSKYDLVLSSLEELYDPSGAYKHQMLVALRHQRGNTLLELTIRFFSHTLFNIARLFLPKTFTHIPGPLTGSGEKRIKAAYKKVQSY